MCAIIDVFFRDSGILGTHEKDILTSISPDGTVIISTRLQATLYCSMDLRKFPFDQQQCKTVLESWMYNGSQVKLHWESKTPVAMGPENTQHITEYVLMKTFTNETMINADLNDLRYGAMTLINFYNLFKHDHCTLTGTARWLEIILH